MSRDYQREYGIESTLRRSKRASRNRARYKLRKQGRVAKGDGKDVDHRNGNAMDNRPGNLSVMGRVANNRKR